MALSEVGDEGPAQKDANPKSTSAANLWNVVARLLGKGGSPSSLTVMQELASEREAVKCLNQRISWYGKTLGHVKPIKECIRIAKTALSK